MRSARVRWDAKASWYPDAKVELLQFPKGGYKDQVDALAWLGMMITRMHPAVTEEVRLQQKREEDQYNYDAESTFFGADPDTGY